MHMEQTREKKRFEEEAGKNTYALSDRNKQKKPRAFKFSRLKNVNVDDVRKCSSEISLRVFLPFGEPSFSSYYDIKVMVNPDFPPSRIGEFAYRLMKHVSIDLGLYFRLKYKGRTERGSS